MALTPSLCRPGTPDMSRPRTPADLRRRAAPLSAPRAPQRTAVCSAQGPAPKAHSAASLAAVSVAGVAAAASIFAPVGPALTSTQAVAAEIVVHHQASDTLQLSLPSTTAPALSFLADGEELTPEERAKSVMAEYKRRKEEEAAAKAAAAAAAAEEAGKSKPVFEAVKPEEPAKPAKVERTRAAAPAPAPAPKAEPAPVAKKGSKRGGIPLFVSQFGVLLAYSGMIAAVVVVPDSKWKAVSEKLQVAGETAAPVLENAWVKSQPALEQAKVLAGELIVEARPYAIKAYEAAKPVAIDLYEKAKPLAIKAWQAGLAYVTEALNKKDEGKVEVVAPAPAPEKKSAV